MSAKSAGSSSAADAPWRTSSARTRSRTRPCSSAITCSLSIPFQLAVRKMIADLKAFIRPRSYRQCRRRRGDDLVFLLQTERQPTVAGQAERVVGAVAPLDAALTRFVGIAVLGVFGDGSIIPVPLDR